MYLHVSIISVCAELYIVIAQNAEEAEGIYIRRGGEGEEGMINITIS